MTIAQRTKFLEYDRSLGMTVMEGKGFYYPVDTVVGREDRLYVISRTKILSRGATSYHAIKPGWC
jgi:hypothetical protein